MKICTTVNYAGDLKGAADQAAELESAGVDLVWVAEAYGADAVSVMGYLAAKTTTMQIGSGILPVYTRTPTLIAQTAVGLDLLSDGRFVLGLGASGPQVIEGWHGMPYDKPLGRTRDVVDICRKVWRRERVTHDGRTYQIPLPEGEGTGLGKPLKIITHPVRADIPIYIASLGGKNVELTAELAEGWLPIFFLPEKADQVWSDAQSIGLQKRDPSLPALETVASTMLAIGPESEVGPLRDFGRPMTALYVGGMGARGKNFYNTLFQKYGYEGEAKQIQDLYLDGKKDEAAALVPDEFLKNTSLVGDEGFIRDRIAAYKEAGVTWLSVNVGGPEPAKQLEKLKEIVS